MVREMEPRYEGQSKEEQTKEYRELHAIYQKYWDEAVRRGMVPSEKLKPQQPVTNPDSESRL